MIGVHEDHEEEQLKMSPEPPTAPEQLEVPSERPSFAKPGTLAKKMAEQLRAL